MQDECFERGCPQWTGTGAYCYYHEKVRARLITGYYWYEPVKVGAKKGKDVIEIQAVWHATRLAS